MHKTLWVFIVLAHASVGAFAAESSTKFSEQEKQQIQQYFKDKRAQQSLYQQYHSDSKSTAKPASAPCPHTFKIGAVVPLETIADAQLLPPTLQALVTEHSGHLSLIKGQCVFRLLDSNRTMIDWISVD